MGSSPTLANIFICDDCCRAQGRKYPHSRTVGYLTWSQYVQHKKTECPHRVLPTTTTTTRKSNNANAMRENISMSESISAKILKLPKLPTAEEARKIYERMKNQQDVNIEQAAAHARIELAQQKNREKAENKKKIKRMARL
jgi:hypothetical protein